MIELAAKFCILTIVIPLGHMCEKNVSKSIEFKRFLHGINDEGTSS